jgi:hypothetical protein
MLKAVYGKGITMSRILKADGTPVQNPVETVHKIAEACVLDAVPELNIDDIPMKNFLSEVYIGWAALRLGQQVAKDMAKGISPGMLNPLHVMNVKDHISAEISKIHEVFMSIVGVKEEKEDETETDIEQSDPM